MPLPAPTVPVRSTGAEDSAGFDRDRSDGVDQKTANALIERGNHALASGELDEAIGLYRAAIDRNPAYVSFELVIGDALHDAGRLTEAIDAYRSTVDAIPEHDQAWERLAECLYRVGRRAEGDQATRRLEELRSALRPDDADDLIERLRNATDINRRATVICELAYSLDERASQPLHEWLGEVYHDRRTGRHGSGNTFWSAVAFVLVRFGMADFVDWYTDGPAPSEQWLMEDVEKYLRKYRTAPPPVDRQQPIRFNHPG